MAGKTNTSATFFAQKKLLGKAHTSNLKVDGEEVIGSNIQSSTGLLFGEAIPKTPAQTLYALRRCLGLTLTSLFCQVTTSLPHQTRGKAMAFLITVNWSTRLSESYSWYLLSTPRLLLIHTL